MNFNDILSDGVCCGFSYFLFFLLSSYNLVEYARLDSLVFFIQIQFVTAATVVVAVAACRLPSLLSLVQIYWQLCGMHSLLKRRAYIRAHCDLSMVAVKSEWCSNAMLWIAFMPQTSNPCRNRWFAKCARCLIKFWSKRHSEFGVKIGGKIIFGGACIYTHTHQTPEWMWKRIDREKVKIKKVRKRKMAQSIVNMEWTLFRCFCMWVYKIENA